VRRPLPVGGAVGIGFAEQGVAIVGSQA
jgi:hypothetical protein